MDPHPDAKTTQQAERTTAPVRPLAVARDVAMLWILSATAGFIVGVASGGPRNMEAFALGIVAANVLAAVLSFAISGALNPDNRWRHLGWVALFAWATSIANVIFLGFPVTDWLMSAPLIAILMGIGGALSPLLRKIFSVGS